MKNVIGNILGGSAAVIIVAAIILIAPMVMYWSLNTIFEQSNIQAYIPHNVWTYISGFGIMLALRGGKS